MYPFGGNAERDYAGRVGLYLRLLQPPGAPNVECDATFSLTLRCLTDESASPPATSQRGVAFRCGMTFCPASEAGNSVGRCEDWGAHVYPTALLLRELEELPEADAVVDVEMHVWASREVQRGASLAALADQGYYMLTCMPSNDQIYYLMEPYENRTQFLHFFHVPPSLSLRSLARRCVQSAAHVCCAPRLEARLGAGG